MAAQTPRALDVVADLKRNRDEHLADKHRIEVIDPGKEPQRAAGDQNVATLTPIRKLPEPIKKIIGALNDTQRVLLGMDLRGVA